MRIQFLILKQIIPKIPLFSSSHTTLPFHRVNTLEAPPPHTHSTRGLWEVAWSRLPDPQGHYRASRLSRSRRRAGFNDPGARLCLGVTGDTEASGWAQQLQWYDLLQGSIVGAALFSSLLACGWWEWLKSFVCDNHKVPSRLNLWGRSDCFLYEKCACTSSCGKCVEMCVGEIVIFCILFTHSSTFSTHMWLAWKDQTRSIYTTRYNTAYDTCSFLVISRQPHVTNTKLFLSYATWPVIGKWLGFVLICVCWPILFPSIVESDSGSQLH